MSFLGGIMKSLVNPMSLMQIAMGPAGWASLAMKTIGSQIAMQVIQKLGQQLGLPQPMIDMAQAAFANASGQPGLARQNIREAVQGFVKQMDLRPSEAGRLERDLMGVSDKSLSNMTKVVDDFASNIDKIRQRQINGSQGGEETEETEGQSLLMKIAIAMGKQMDQKMEEMDKTNKAIGALGKQENGQYVTGEAAQKQGTQQKLGELTGKLQGLGQELGMLSNALSNTLKSIGEANTTLARKG
jgi:hypothetical protein